MGFKHFQHPTSGSIERKLVYVTIASMATDHIVSLLIAERDKLDRAIEALQGTAATRKPVASAEAPASAPVTEEAAAPKARKKRRPLTAAQRKAHKVRMQEYWAAKRKA